MGARLFEQRKQGINGKLIQAKKKKKKKQNIYSKILRLKKEELEGILLTNKCNTKTLSTIALSFLVYDA